MKVYLSIWILIFFTLVPISADKIKTQINFYGSSNKYRDIESRHIRHVCNRYEGEICSVGFVSFKQKKKCIPWNETAWHRDVLYNHTTICSKFQSQLCWCAIDYDQWDHCPPIKCKYIYPHENICHDQIFWSSTKSSIIIDFSRAIASQKHEILLILSSLDHSGKTVQCFITKICKGQCSSIDRFYHDSCINASNTIINGSKVVTFANLTQDTNQILYLMPVIDDDTIGSVMTTLSMRTILPVPHAPLNIAILDKSSTSIKLGWSPSTKSGNYGPPEGYQVTMIGGDRILNTTTNYIVFDNLSQCRLHCFAVASFNKAGKSADFKHICTNTTTDFETVKLPSMDPDFPDTRIVTWQYSDANTCPVIFKIRYAVSNDDEKAFAVTTWANIIQLNGMETDLIYSVKVRPTFDGQNGEYSSIKYFHTFRVPDIPYILTIYEKRTSRIKLTWALCERSDEYGPAQRYQVTMTNDLSYKIQKTSTNEIVFDNLRSCTKFCFVVASFNMAGKSADSQRVCANTETDFKRVDLLQVTSFSSDTKNVSWRYNNGSHCAVIFEVHYSVKNNSRSTIILSTRSRDIQLERVAVDQIYTVKVRPKDDEKYGFFSSSIYFHTFRKPETPDGIRIIRTMSTTIFLQWRKCRKTETFGSVQRYSITIYNSSMTSMHSTSKESYDFSNLRNSSKYCFIVVAYNLAGTSNQSHPICGNTSAEILTIFDVKIVKTMPTAILLQWQKSIEPAREYIITIYNKTSRALYNTSMQSHNFYNLCQCSYYCFTVASSNATGTFNDSNTICGYTSTDFDEVTWLPVKSLFFTSPTITWAYNNTYKCNIIFHVEYFMKNHQNQLFFNETSDTQIRLDDLSTNDIYAVRVRPMFSIWRGRFSLNRELYPKNVIPIIKEIQIYSYKNDISILWNVDASKSMPSYMFMLKLSNMANECLYLVRLICSSCLYEIDESIMNETQRQYLRKINICHVTQNDTFHEDYVQFSNTIPTNGSAISGRLVIYSVNVLGVYELGIQNFFLDFKSRENKFAQKEREATNLKFLLNVKNHLRKFENLIEEYINKLHVLMAEVNNIKVEVMNKDKT